MPKPNYAFAKRQRDMAKRQKKEAKRLKKAAAGASPAETTEDAAPGDATATQPGTPQGSEGPAGRS